MSFFSPNQVNELADFAADADRDARIELNAGVISGEDDYTSNFTRNLRVSMNNSATGLSATSITSFKLPSGVEQKSGTDAAIILTNNASLSKVILFEAKWPRFSKQGYRWDYKQTKTGISHFSSQLERQKALPSQFSIFEMFYCEFPLKQQPSFLKDEHSSCVWHKDATTFNDARNNPNVVWNHQVLQNLLIGNSTNIRAIMSLVGLCMEGDPLEMADPYSIASEFGLTCEILAIKAREERATDSISIQRTM